MSDTPFEEPYMTADEQPLDECDQCGADLYDAVPHDCPVGGNVVIAKAQVAEENDTPVSS